MNSESSASSQSRNVEAIGGITRPLQVEVVGGLGFSSRRRHAPQSTIYDFAVQVAMTTTAALVMGSLTYFLQTKMQDNTCPAAGSTHIAKVLEKKGRNTEILETLNEHELHVLGDVVDPEHLVTKFEDIGGLARQKQIIFDSIMCAVAVAWRFEGR